MRQLRNRCAVHGVSQCDPTCTAQLHGVYVDDDAPAVNSAGEQLADTNAAEQFAQAAEQLAQPFESYAAFCDWWRDHHSGEAPAEDYARSVGWVA
jgi:hypothetical protein